MNNALVNYGIQTEKSQWRAHVCFKAGYIYIFATEAGRRALNNGPEAYAKQALAVGPTARGRKVPWQSIDGIREIPIPPDIMAANVIEEDEEDTTIKGQLAVAIFMDTMYQAHGTLLPMCEVTDMAAQIEGTDIRIDGKRIQVKCDYPGGRKPNGTGNLFLQTHECNPFRKT